MPWFRCFIEGQNFPGSLIDEKGPIGFYTTRFVEAESAIEAEKTALMALKSEEALQLPTGEGRPVNAKIFFEEIEQVDVADVPKTKPGFTFFVMGT